MLTDEEARDIMGFILMALLLAVLILALLHKCGVV